MSASDLALYHFDGCPYCGRVRDAIARLGIQVELRDVHASDRHLDDLVGATGRQMVPCLRIAGPGGEDRWMHESADIVRYLEQRFA